MDSVTARKEKIGEIVKPGLVRTIFNFFSKRIHTNPYSPSLDYFMREVSHDDPKQIRYMSEYANYPELKTFIDMNVDRWGNVLSFNVPTEKEKDYNDVKNALIKKHQYNG